MIVLLRWVGVRMGRVIIGLFILLIYRILCGVILGNVGGLGDVEGRRRLS